VSACVRSTRTRGARTTCAEEVLPSCFGWRRKLHHFADMPTVGVGRDDLMRTLGKEYTEEEFDELCFEARRSPHSLRRSPHAAPTQTEANHKHGTAYTDV
jgi:hypothetical protein